MMIYGIIHHDDEDTMPKAPICPIESETHHDSTNVPKNLDLVTSEGYGRYIGAHGYHFTQELAEHASSKMTNASGAKHTWNSNEVESALRSMGYRMPSHMTIGDMTYLSNMAYADLFPSVLPDEVMCIRYSMAIADDPDGYEGMPFHRWLADVMATEGQVDWEKYI